MNEVYRFIDKDFADFLYRETLESTSKVIDDGQVIGSQTEYKNPSMIRLLSFLKPKVEELYGKRLHETYAFYRIYTEGMELEPHTDRPACEVSVTLTLGYHAQYLWPIYVDGIPFATTPGEGIIYKGCEQKHWREPFRKVGKLDDDIVWSQVFLHYIEAGGQYDPEHKGDAYNERINSDN